MTKRLVALRGKGQVGKTTSLHNLNRLLLSEPNAKTVKFTKYGYKLDFSQLLLITPANVSALSVGVMLLPTWRASSQNLSPTGATLSYALREQRGEIEEVLASYANRGQLIEVPKVGCHRDYFDASNLAAAHQLAAYVYGAMVP
ncbi:hypothetical protein [Pseudoxanthomonas sp. SE1]|uniref:hypothetical protein n=1 Tax=Pseudoxanthomonas sp. SE1 TaxID=1664560 RepID=UPI00240CF0E8|nr:hypothetical protein [Pseudoxanthomonas sp. SE1]WFC40831.1 hypothetical protein OY559_13565 [Pseudoxanthomonas sp. SE1]